MMLAQVLESSDCLVQAAAVTSLADEMFDHLDEHAVAAICVSATPPAAVMHARYLCKRLRGRLPKVKLIVGLWDTQGDLDKAKERIGCDAVVVATLAEAQEQIRLMIQPRVPPFENQAESDHGLLVMAAPQS